MKAPALLPILLAIGFAAALALPRAAAPSFAAGSGREVLLTAPANLPPGVLGESVNARVSVSAHVEPSGLVDSARAVSGDARLRANAEASARWWVFAPAKQAGWVDVTVPFHAAPDAPGIRPDVISMARESEARGDFATALAAWTGALARTGTSPVVENPWELREHVIEVARRMPEAPQPSGIVAASVRQTRAQQERTVARSDHEDLVKKFDDAIAGAPWWAEPWMWRAGSLAGCGRTAEALRSLRTYRLASTDSAGRAFANRMIGRLAQSDTIGVSEAIKTWRVVTETPTR